MGRGYQTQDIRPGSKCLTVEPSQQPKTLIFKKCLSCISLLNLKFIPLNLQYIHSNLSSGIFRMSGKVRARLLPGRYLWLFIPVSVFSGSLPSSVTGRLRGEDAQLSLFPCFLPAGYPFTAGRFASPESVNLDELLPQHPYRPDEGLGFLALVLQQLVFQISSPS